MSLKTGKKKHKKIILQQVWQYSAAAIMGLSRWQVYFQPTAITAVCSNSIFIERNHKTKQRPSGSLSSPESGGQFHEIRVDDKIKAS